MTHPVTLAADRATVDCQACGACCAYSHDWIEFFSDDDLDGIPDDMCDMEHGRMKCDGDRCVALTGTIGVKVGCSVYRHRPQVCREFEPGTAACMQVRTYFKIGTVPTTTKETA